MCGFAFGAIMGACQVALLMYRYGGLQPSTAFLGDALEIEVSPPGLVTTLIPFATACLGAVAFVLTADDRLASGKAVLALIVFATICSLWIGFESVAVILTRRWEHASGLAIYCPRRTRLLARGEHVAVVEREPAPVGRRLLPAILLCGLALLAVGVADFTTLVRHESPWSRDLPTLTGQTGVSHIDPNLNAVAATLAGHPVQVRCWSSADWARIRAVRRDDVAGFTNPQTWTTQLSPSVCRPLMALRYRGVEPAGDAEWALSFAVVVLGHEMGHLVNGPSESGAECFGLRAAPRTAQLLGADPAYATRLAQLYRYQIYPRRPAEYRVGGCPA